MTEAQEYALVTRNPSAFVAYTDVLVIFSYLTHNVDLERAIEEYRIAVNKVTKQAPQAAAFGSFTTELLHQSRSKLLYHHMRTGGIYKPARIRELFEESISLFPHNTIFLSLFAWNESRFRIEGRVRDVTRAINSVSPSVETDHGNVAGTTGITTIQQVPVTSHLFAIYTELNRPAYAGSTAHSVRAAFESAVGETTARDESGRRIGIGNSDTFDASAHSNLSLWKLYILFELGQNDIQRAENIFYRAVRACPWSKELAMLAFSYFREDVVDARDKAGKEDVSSYVAMPRRGKAMDFFELRRVYNVLVEKELRVHVDIESLLDEMMLNIGRDGGVVSVPKMPVDKDNDDDATI